jgi:hypothetical protein
MKKDIISFFRALLMLGFQMASTQALGQGTLQLNPPKEAKVMRTSVGETGNEMIQFTGMLSLQS